MEIGRTVVPVRSHAAGSHKRSTLYPRKGSASRVGFVLFPDSAEESGLVWTGSTSESGSSWMAGWKRARTSAYMTGRKPGSIWDMVHELRVGRELRKTKTDKAFHRLEREHT